MKQITYEEFESVDLRSGTIMTVEEFTRIRKPAFKAWADFGVLCKYLFNKKLEV